MKRAALFIVSVVLIHSTDAAAGLWFWDANGVTPGSGSSTPTGTWGVDAYWNEDSTGGTGPYGTNEVTQGWPAGASAVFAAGSDATGAYTITVVPSVQVEGIHVDRGYVTFVGGPINMVNWDGNITNRLLSVGHYDAAAVARYDAPLAGAYGVVRYKRGTVILGATNTYGGPTIIEGGILQLGVPYAIPTNSPLVLRNNDTARPDFYVGWQYTPAVFATDGFSQRLGALMLAGTDTSVQRVIDFGNGSSALAFADGSVEDWGGFTLTITNFTPGGDTLRFGNNASGLTEAQLGLMRFADFANLPGRIDANGFVTPALPVLAKPVRIDSSTVELSWNAAVGRTYRVQAKTNLGAAGWDDLADVYASASPATQTDSSATGDQRYYRLLVLP